MSNLKEVAKLANVSMMTVSRAINTPEKVSEKTREKIEKAMTVLNYSTNPIAKALVKGKTNIVELYIPKHIDINSNYVMLIIAGVSEALSQHQLSMLLIRDFDAHRYSDGVIITGLTKEDHYNVDNYLKFSNKQVVVFGHSDFLQAPHIDVDNVNGFKLGVDHLIECGHRDIAFLNLSEKENERIANERFTGYKESLRSIDKDVKLDQLFNSENYIHTAYEEAKRFLSKSFQFTAIACAADALAVGTLHAAKDLGINVPNELSILGFDGMGVEKISTPSITTVKQPIFEIGKELGEIVVKKINDEMYELPIKMILPTLEVGESIQRID